MILDDAAYDGKTEAGAAFLSGKIRGEKSRSLSSEVTPWPLSANADFEGVAAGNQCSWEISISRSNESWTASAALSTRLAKARFRASGSPQTGEKIEAPTPCAHQFLRAVH